MPHPCRRFPLGSCDPRNRPLSHQRASCRSGTVSGLVLPLYGGRVLEKVRTAAQRPALGASSGRRLAVARSAAAVEQTLAGPRSAWGRARKPGPVPCLRPTGAGGRRAPGRARGRSLLYCRRPARCHVAAPLRPQPRLGIGLSGGSSLIRYRLTVAIPGARLAAAGRIL